MAVSHDTSARVSLRSSQGQLIRRYFKNEAERAEQRAALREEAKEERATLRAKGFDMRALAQAVAERKRDLADVEEPTVAEARELYLDALVRGN